MPKNYTVKQVADILGFSTNSIYTFLKEKRLRGVRIGKGRFRIPEEELARVLHLSKKAVADSTIHPVAPIDTSPLVSDRDVVAPNLFDWFAGLAAIIAGFGFFLFNSSLVQPQVNGFSQVTGAVGLILIAAGGGVLASAVLRQSRGWHQIFHGLLGTLGILNAWILFRGGDIDGAILYGTLGFVLWVGVVTHFPGVVLFGVYMTLLGVLFPVWILGFASLPRIAAAARAFGISPMWFNVVVTIVSAASLLFYWVGYRGKRAALITAGILIAASCLLGAVWYGLMQYWSRAFFLIVLGFFGAMMPHWQKLCDLAPRQQRLVLHGLFAGVGGVLFAAILVVYLLQRNAWMASESEFLNRIATAQNVLTSTIESAQSAAVITAANRDVVAALEKKDAETLIRSSKLLYESNPTIRRVVYLSASGEGVSLYPYGTFDLSNYAFREYFIQARDTKAPYMSNVFQSAVDNVGRYVSVVAVPLFGSKGEFAGVLAVSLDLNRLGFKLRQLAQESRGEYFLILDQNKQVLSHPDVARIGTKLPENDVIYTTPSGQKGVTSGVLSEGVLGLVAYGSIERLGWTVMLRMPVTQVYVYTSHAVPWVFGTVAVVLIAALWLLCFLNIRWSRQSGGGP